LLNAFITLNTHEKSRLGGSLENLAVGVKDIFYTKGTRTTAGSKFLKEFVPEYDASTVATLRQKGAFIIGKTNTHEFAMGATNVNPHYGAVRNPFDTSRISGGSSGGSAVAVATGMAAVALGSDTGGSVRIPAALCGVVGFKPSYGAISKHGVFPLSWSMDHVGFLNRCVRDARTIFENLKGLDEKDPSTDVYQPVEKRFRDLRDTLIGVDHYFTADCEPGVSKNFERTLETLRSHGAKVVNVRFESISACGVAREVILSSEVAAYHKKFYPAYSSEYGDDVRRRIELGLRYSAVDYISAQRMRSVIVEEFAKIFEEVDALVCPTVKVAAPLISDSSTPETRKKLITNTEPFNMTGQPAISVPNGFTEGLPTAVQICCSYGSDDYLLGLAKTVENLLNFGEALRQERGELK
jgi:aspartyl-tRNA(Asn)/glutamyl-tRNA(Gln) amidotransferase subunit A